MARRIRSDQQRHGCEAPEAHSPRGDTVRGLAAPPLSHNQAVNHSHHAHVHHAHLHQQPLGTSAVANRSMPLALEPGSILFFITFVTSTLDCTCLITA